MRIFKKAAVSMTVFCLLALGAVVGVEGPVLAATGPDGLITGCEAQVNVVANGLEPNCEAIGGTIDNPTVIAVYVDTDNLGALIDDQPGQGMDASWTLSCVVNGASVNVPGTYDVTSTSQAPYTIIDLQTAVGSPTPNQCSMENLTVQTALTLGVAVSRLSPLRKHALDGPEGFTVGVAAVANTAVPGAVYQTEGTTKAGAQAALCADDTANGTAGSKIQGFQCLSDLADAFVQTKSGQLVHNGDCVGLSGSKVILSTCTAGEESQEWRQSAVGARVWNRSTGTCLTAPSALAGVQLTVTPCGNEANQKWHLPPAAAAPALPGLSSASIWRALRLSEVSISTRPVSGQGRRRDAFASGIDAIHTDDSGRIQGGNVWDCRIEGYSFITPPRSPVIRGQRLCRSAPVKTIKFRKGMTQMQLKLPTVAARTAAAGVAAVLCLGGAQAAQAAPRPGGITVPCNAAALSTAVSDAASGATLYLTSGCTYVLTAGLAAITDTLTIDGRGATVERSYASGTKDFSIFTVDAVGGDLNLNNVNVQHGGGGTDYYGGAIDSSGAVAIDGGTFGENNSDEYGGAIYNDGSLTVRNASFLDNADYAGAIYSYGVLAVTGTTFTGNTGSDGYGGAIYTEAVNAQIADSKFTDNSSDYEGGAIDNDYDMTLTGSTFTGNESEYGGAVYTVEDSIISGDTFTGNGAAFGGGLYNDSVTTTADNSTFIHNASYYGGGIYNDAGRLEIQHDVISLNTAADEGGGIYNEAALTTDSTFSVKDNSAGVGGGGIYNSGSGSVNLFYAQVSGNNPDNCEPVNTIGGCDN